ncbi:MAG TPA: OsmC family protein [Firmicutes bacterium]|nr:OsmC family protein [Candidatus Fermentithermobacillaceae bacterium]
MGTVRYTLQLRVEGVKNESRPRRFTEIHINYDVQCEGLTGEALDKYLRITERVCPAVQSLNAGCRLAYTLNE